MSGKLSTYQKMRDFKRTPEPAAGDTKRKSRRKAPRFVIQEHHATALHWDFRLERDGVLVSWAVPKGLPVDKTNHLAVHTEDHPLSYFDFEGEIPAGQYGGGQVYLWDQGTYEEEKWTDREVKVVLHGKRVEGEYVLFQTDGKNWMVRRKSPPVEGYEPMPETLSPMLATLARSMPSGEGWAYEFKWDGVRTIAFVDGGRVRLQSRNSLDSTKAYPEMRELGLALGSRRVILDGEIVAMDEAGRPSFSALQPRMHVTSEAKARRLMEEVPVTYLVFDLLYLDTRSTMSLPFAERRALLESLALDGRCWQTTPSFTGDGDAVLKTSVTQQLEGVIAKRLDSPYVPGRRAETWRKVKNIQRQEVVVGGWTHGEGGRAGQLGALLIGVYDGKNLRYAGHVGTGFTQATLADLGARLKPLARKTSPFADTLPRAHAAKAEWVEPKLVCDVEFTEWTRDGRLRHPSYKGLRNDKKPREVVREVPK